MLGTVDQNLKTLNADTGAMTFIGPVQGGGQSIVKVLTYVSGTPVAWDVSLGQVGVVAITDGVAFSIAAPTNLAGGQTYILTIKNTSGGVLGAGTWNAIFKVVAAVPAIATGFNRSFVFYFDGTNMIEVSAPATDIPN